MGYFFYQGANLSDITDMISKDATISDEDLARLYIDSRPDLMAGYKKGSNPIANDYENWQAGSTIPANPGVHRKRYMMTYVNDIGHGVYTEYGTQKNTFPVGTKIAKESFTVKGKGRFSPSQLFTMEKTGLDKAPDTDGWVYGRVNRNGRKMITSQKFCHSCHEAFRFQDSVGFPVKKARFETATPKVSSLPAVLAPGDAAKGQALFQSCASCHGIGPDARNAFGPVLTGIVGRKASSYQGYKYSPSLQAAKDKGLVWDEQQLFDWLAGPSEFLQSYLADDSASSRMPVNFEDPEVRNNIIAYLKTQSEAGN